MSTETMSKVNLIFGLPEDYVYEDVRGVIAKMFARLTVEKREKNKEDFAANLVYLIHHEKILAKFRGPLTHIVKVGFVDGKLYMFVYLVRLGITVECEIRNRPMIRMFTSGWNNSDWVPEEPIIMDDYSICH